MPRGVRRVVALGATGCFLTACTKTVRVQELEYRTLQPRKGTYLDVRTVDGSRYHAEAFTITDSTIVIEKLRDYGAYPASHIDLDVPSYLPYAVVFDSVISVDRVQTPSTGKVFVFVLVGVAGLVAIIYVSTVRFY